MEYPNCLAAIIVNESELKKERESRQLTNLGHQAINFLFSDQTNKIQSQTDSESPSKKEISDLDIVITIYNSKSIIFCSKLKDLQNPLENDQKISQKIPEWVFKIIHANSNDLDFPKNNLSIYLKPSQKFKSINSGYFSLSSYFTVQQIKEWILNKSKNQLQSIGQIILTVGEKPLENHLTIGSIKHYFVKPSDEIIINCDIIGNKDL